MFPPIPFFAYLWVQLLFLLLPPVSLQLLRAGKDITRFLPSRMLTLLLFYNAPSNLVYAHETIQFARWLFFKLHLTHSSLMLKIIIAIYDPTQILLQHHSIWAPIQRFPTIQMEPCPIRRSILARVSTALIYIPLWLSGIYYALRWPPLSEAISRPRRQFICDTLSSVIRTRTNRTIFHPSTNYDSALIHDPPILSRLVEALVGATGLEPTTPCL